MKPKNLSDIDKRIAFRSALVLLAQRYFNIEQMEDINDLLTRESKTGFSYYNPDHARQNLIDLDITVGAMFRDDEEREEYSRLFDLVKNKEHWKNPIHAIIDPKEIDVDMLGKAIVYFTATQASFTPTAGGKLIVSAAGYFNGPAN